MQMDRNLRTGISVYRIAYSSPQEKVFFSNHGLTVEPQSVHHHMATFPGSLIPLEAETECTTVYGSRTRTTVSEVPTTTFDRLFHQKKGYDAKLKRDDRMRFLEIGKAVCEEEAGRPWPVISSSEYGRRVRAPVEPMNRGASRINHLQNEIAHSKGIGLPPVET